MPIITLPSIVRPSYSQGFARNKTQAKSPWLWDGLRGLWVPALGRTGLTLFDVSGRKNHGTLENMDSSDWVAGEQGYALDFDGSEDRVAVGSNMWNSDGPVTLSFWNFAGLTDVNGFGGHGTTEANDRFQTHAPFSDGILYWDYGTFTGSGRVSVSYGGFEDKWTLVTLLSAGVAGGGMSIWLDGVERATSGVSGGPSGAIDFNIGAYLRVSPSSFFHTGKIGNVAIWNRILLPTEIQQLSRDPLAPLRLRDYQIPIAGEAAVGGLLVHPGMAGGMQIMSGGMRA